MEIATSQRERDESENATSAQALRVSAAHNMALHRGRAK